MEEQKITPELGENETRQVSDVPDKPEQQEESLADRVRIVSPGRLVLKRFFRSRLSMVGLVTLILLFLFSFVGPLFSPWDQTEMDMSVPDEVMYSTERRLYNEIIDADEIFYLTGDGKLTGGIIEHPEMRQDVLDAGGKFFIDTYTGWYYPQGKNPDDEEEGKVYFEVTKGATGKVYACYVDRNGKYERITYESVEYSWFRKPFNQLGKIDANHWLGTDEQGMDVLTRLMYGGRISLTLGFVVVILETILGVIFGGIAGYFGKWVDQIIMRIVDILNCIPQLPILMILSPIFESNGVPDDLKIYYIMVVLTLLGWSGVARVVRGQILFLREQEFMIAAEALGLSTSRKIVKHLVPNILPQLIVQMTLGLGGIILTESTLSYLGIGVPFPRAAWGTMISSAQRTEILQFYPNLWIPAGVLIVLAVLAFNFIGDGLRDAFDPKASR